MLRTSSVASEIDAQRASPNTINDSEPVSAFRQGIEMHWIAVGMHRIQGETNKDKRDKSRAVNFGILFQMTADGLSRELNTDRNTAQGT